MYLAAAVHNDTRARFFDALSMNGVAQIADKYPQASVIFADKAQRASDAPTADDLFNLLVARAKPFAARIN
jgi:hypothetical protein